MAKYLKIETSDKKKITSLIEDVIESKEQHRIYVQKLENGNYEVEVIQAREEPPISS